jgi:peptidoglycan-N-acetylglucosamine deacetylase
MCIGFSQKTNNKINLGQQKNLTSSPYLPTMYTISTPAFFSRMFPSLLWHGDRNEKKIYLSFDDGPHPVATTFVLQTLAKHNAKASFFCIGKNVQAHPNIYQQIIAEGHCIGNHTHNHLSGWTTDTNTYMENIGLAKQYIDSRFFRPPYGRIKPSQVKQIQNAPHNMQVVMWDVLSGDFDISISPQDCLQNVLRHTKPGSIVVFHDSEKAFERMQFALPKMIEHFQQQGFQFAALSQP